MDISDGSFHYWSTDESHHDNLETMSDFLLYELDEEWSLTLVDGTYAEISHDSHGKFEVHASGDGDSFNHKVEFKKIK